MVPSLSCPAPPMVMVFSTLCLIMSRRQTPGREGIVQVFLEASRTVPAVLWALIKWVANWMNTFKALIGGVVSLLARWDLLRVIQVSVSCIWNSVSLSEWSEALTLPHSEHSAKLHQEWWLTFVVSLLWARLGFKHALYLVLTTALKCGNYYPRFIDKSIEVQRDVTCLLSSPANKF